LGSHPVAVVKYTYTHKQYREQHKTNNTYNNKKYIEQHKNSEECGPCPVFVGFTLAFVLQLRKKAFYFTEFARNIIFLGKARTVTPFTGPIPNYLH
jgi:hypothetical protein